MLFMLLGCVGWAAQALTLTPHCQQLWHCVWRLGRAHLWPVVAVRTGMSGHGGEEGGVVSWARRLEVAAMERRGAMHVGCGGWGGGSSARKPPPSGGVEWNVEARQQGVRRDMLCESQLSRIECGGVGLHNNTGCGQGWGEDAKDGRGKGGGATGDICCVGPARGCARRRTGA